MEFRNFIYIHHFFKKEKRAFFLYENRIIKIYNWFSIIKCITLGGREILCGLISSQVKPADFHGKA